jgi:hypothetical protein
MFVNADGRRARLCLAGGYAEDMAAHLTALKNKVENDSRMATAVAFQRRCGV